MKGLFIPDITAEMFRNECLESIEALMAEGEIYDIDYEPSAQPERKKGEWIKIDKYDKESNVQCSVCLEDFDYIDGVCYLCHGYELPLFCPNCGADMRGDENE